SNLILSSNRVALITNDTVFNVVSIIRDFDNAELWNTNDNNGRLSGQTIFLPTDTLGNFGDSVTVVYNAIDVFNTTMQGNFNENVISVTPSSEAVAGKLVEVNY